jgi:hypothetical protein
LYRVRGRKAEDSGPIRDEKLGERSGQIGCLQAAFMEVGLIGNREREKKKRWHRAMNVHGAETKHIVIFTAVKTSYLTLSNQSMVKT